MHIKELMGVLWILHKENVNPKLQFCVNFHNWHQCVWYLIFVMSTAFLCGSNSKHRLQQEDMQIRLLCANENQPCPDPATLTEESSPGFPSPPIQWSLLIRDHSPWIWNSVGFSLGGWKFLIKKGNLRRSDAVCICVHERKKMSFVTVF